ncbi:MAG: hypothetical protein Q9178_000321 [Gyalolechia marmorata]
MASDTYLKVGRGGAGNYYSRQDIQQVQNQVDIEAQTKTAGELRAADAKEREYVHSGRGGAGNYSSASDAAERKRSVDMTPSTRERTVPEGGFYGRGGAGNLRGSDGDPSGEDIEMTATVRQKEAYEEAVQDVEKGLRAPEKAHLANTWTE